MKDKKPLIISLAVALGVGGLSALLTRRSMGIYETVARPPLSPPPWVFPAAWTILYILMAVAAYIVWRSADPGRSRALGWYGAQLAFNFFWPQIFFNGRAFGLALVWIAALWALVFITWRRFADIDRRAGRLFIPYLVWLTFAVYLNAGIWLLNR